MTEQLVAQDATSAPPGRSPVVRHAAFGAAALLVVLLLRFSSQGVPDPDSFYHYRHAALYAEKGLLVSAFPWLPYSILSRFASDIGYGFHVFLIPFTYLRDPILGIKLAAVAETVIVMLILYAVLRRHRCAYTLAWPFVLLFLAPPIIWTVFQTRPQTLTMGFSALLVSAMLIGSAPGAFVAAFATGFVHLNIIPIVPALVVITAVVKGLIERRWEWQTWAAALAGAVAGWALRPNQLGAARLEWVQIAVHEVVRQKGIPLLFGREWSPVALPALGSFACFITIWVGMSAVLLIAIATSRHSLSRSDRAFLWSSLVLSVLFFVGAVAVTKRATPFWATFAVMFVAKAFTCFLDPGDQRPGQLLRGDARIISAAFVAVLAAAMVWTGISEHMIQGKWRGIPPDRLKAASLWLKDHGRPGDVVYNANWDMFPELFFWNQDDRYVSGLDPIFLYAYDERLYWKAHHLQTGEATDRTWGTMGYPAGSEEDTYTVLRRDFKASAVVLEMARNAGLYQYLRSDRRFVLAFQDATYAVFTLK
jgi:hypothetical protein